VAKPGEGNAVEPFLARYAEKAHEDPGCRLYCLQRGTVNRDHFVVVEKWISAEHFDKHLEGDPETFDIWAKLEPLLASRPVVTPSRPVGAGLPSKSDY
jgi:quinol monooxygenase YgiN